MDNIIFHFTGTGNSLKVAKTISKALNNTEIVSMGKLERNNPLKQYDTIGFVYPVYFYGIATFGGLPGNGISQLHELLMNKHNIRLNYGKTLKMFSNYIIAYDMNNKVNEITNKSDKNTIPIIKSIKNKENTIIKRPNRLFNIVYNKNVTQNRGRYTNPDISYTELSERNM